MNKSVNVNECEKTCAVTFASSAGVSVALGMAALIGCAVTTGPASPGCIALAVGSKYVSLATEIGNFIYCLSNCPDDDVNEQQ